MRTYTAIIASFFIAVGAVAPISSRAAAISTDFVFGISPTPVAATAFDGSQSDFAAFFVSGSFSGFNPALGTLTAVDVNISTLYTLTEGSIAFPISSLVFKQTLNFPISNVRTLSTGANVFPATIPDFYFLPTITNPSALSDFLHPLVTQDVEVQLNENGLTVSLGTLAFDGTAHITYTYTAAVAETPLPTALPLFASGTGVFTFLGWRRKTKKPPRSA
jgi:hypothetical protein